MPRRFLALAAALLLLAPACSSDGDAGTSSASSSTSAPAAESDPVTLATEAYVAGYPLVVSTRTMETLGGLLGVNSLFWQSQLSGPSARLIVAPNRDTLYSVAVLDLRSEPMVLTLPAVTDRYYTYQFVDAWTESFAYLGTRATGGRAGSWVITPPGWEGTLPEGTERIEATTPQVFLLGRYLVQDDADIANVTAIKEQVTLQPLSSLTGEPAPPPPPPLPEASGTPQDIPADASFFDELGDDLAVNPPATEAQKALFATFEPLGIGAGLHPTETADPETLAALDEGAAAGDAAIESGAAGIATVVNGWNVNLAIGRYGDDIETRALVARVGWGANVPEEAVYPTTSVDAEGDPLDGAETYTITFPADGLPPVTDDGFWSLTVYGPDRFFTEHPSGRYSIGDRTPGLVYGPDGSLEIVLSHEAPPSGESNWLPVPEGEFNLMLRLYLPEQQVLDGDWEIPPVVPVP